MHVSGHADGSAYYYRRSNSLKSIALVDGLHKNRLTQKAQITRGAQNEYLRT